MLIAAIFADALYSVPEEVGIALTIGQVLLTLVPSYLIASWWAVRPLRAAAGESWVGRARAS